MAYACLQGDGGKGHGLHWALDRGEDLWGGDAGCSLLQSPGKWQWSSGKYRWLPAPLTVATAEPLCSQGSENNGWHSIAVSTSAMTPRWLGPQVVPVHRPLVVASHAHIWSLRWLPQLAPSTCSLYERCPTTQEPLCVCVEIFLCGPTHSPLTLSNNGTSLFLQAQSSLHTPSSVVLCSPACGTLLPNPLGCLHKSTRVYSLELTSGAWVLVPSPCPSISGCGAVV